ncbi:tumor necrosis factor ligand superfamily member 11 [Gastrophryne carolinensis]
MGPGGYLRGAAELGGPAEIAKQPHNYSKPVYVALILLALLQVACTLGLFLYVKAQMEPSWMREKEFQCWRTILKMTEGSTIEDKLSDDKGTFKTCQEMKTAFTAAVQREIQALNSQRQSHVGNDITDTFNRARNGNYQTWPVAHLTLDTPGDHTLSQFNSWKYKDGWAHLQNMSYYNGTLKILQDGYYFVYANICFRHHKATSKVLPNPLQLMLYVSKLNKNGRPSDTLMKGGKTEVFSNNSAYNFYSVYQGGVFKLLAGEGIFIKVSYTALMDPAQEATYFGAFKLLDIHI